MQTEMIDSFKILTKNIISFFENNLFKESDIGCSELNVIKSIYEYNKVDKKLNVTELAHLLKMSKSAVSQSISKLERKGLVKRKINLFDKKVNYITLTEHAICEYENKQKEYNEMVVKVSNQMGEKDVKELSRLLEKLSDIINVLGKEGCSC